MRSSPWGVDSDNTYYCRSGGGWRILARGLTAYTPTIQNLTLGSGGQADGSYVVAGGVVTAYTRIAFGGGGSVAANPVIGMPLDLPERPALPVGLAYLTDASAPGAAGRRAFTVVRNTATTVTMMNGHDGNTPNPSYPWTWASGDTIVMQTSYQVA